MSEDRKSIMLSVSSGDSQGKSASAGEFKLIEFCRRRPMSLDSMAKISLTLLYEDSLRRLLRFGSCGVLNLFIVGMKQRGLPLVII